MDQSQRIHLAGQNSPFSNPKLWGLYGTDYVEGTLPTRTEGKTLDTIISKVKEDYTLLYKDTLKKKEKAEARARDLQDLVTQLKNENATLSSDLQVSKTAGQSANGETNGRPYFGAKDERINELTIELKRAEAQHMSMVEGIESLQGTNTLLSSTVENLKLQILERDARIKELNDEVISKAMLYNMNSQEFNQECLEELRRLGVSLQPQDAGSTHSLIIFFVKELKSMMATVTTLRSQLIQGYTMTTITEMETELTTLRKSKAVYQEKEIEILELRRRIGELSAQIDWAQQVKAESELLHARNVDLEKAVHTKEKIIKDLYSAVSFIDYGSLTLNQQGGIAGQQVAGTPSTPTGHNAGFSFTTVLASVDNRDMQENIPTLMALVRKFRDDYNFLYAEYISLKGTLHLQQGVSSGIRKRSGDQISLEKKKSNSEHASHHIYESNMVMDEEATLAHPKPSWSRPAESIGSGDHARYQELVCLVERIFGWRIELLAGTARVIYKRNPSYYIDFSVNSELKPSETLEAVIASEAADIFTVSEDVSFLMANLTLLIKTD